MKQQVWLEVLKPDNNNLNALDKYDGSRPLENYLWVHVRNRLYNFKRNNYARPDKPCDNCPLKAYVNHECTAFKNIMECEHYSKWFDRNEVKKSLMATKEQDDQSAPLSREESPIEDKILGKQIYNLIGSNIPVSMREDWIRYTNKVKLAKNKREALFEKIIEILKENGIDPQAW